MMAIGKDESDFLDDKSKSIIMLSFKDREEKLFLIRVS